MIDYCVEVIDKVVDEKRRSISGQEEGLDADQESRSIRSRIFGEEVLVGCPVPCSPSLDLFLLCTTAEPNKTRVDR